ncbi:uncharacterized protein LOC111277433 [Durio zibethinus]|uniref:Uncharacterized protein LOC111277433 n=1 Tax=Durio zibethinus TaxID=66656 RepID=A0A6P5WVC8_DURZI|nr:uncharacterized protein LOC111277433 [Durio zibethinus]
MDSPAEPKRMVAFVLIDELGNVSIPRFGNKTPLQAANVPNLDVIASARVNGLMDPVEVGLVCGNDTAHLSLLGYATSVLPRARYDLASDLIHDGGDRLKDFTYSFFQQSNFTTLDKKTGIVRCRKADRHFEENGPILCAALHRMKLPSFLDDEVKSQSISYMYATEHRCVVVKGPRLSGNISGTDPLKDNCLLLEAKPSDDTDEARHTALVNELSREISKILVSHPLNEKRLAKGKNTANIVLLRGCDLGTWG